MSRVDVDGFAALVARRFVDGVNAARWSRTLPGDFDEVARLLVPDDGLVVVTPSMLQGLELSAAGRVAADVMIDDWRRLEALGREPVLNCIAGYERDTRGLPIATDVMSFHVDRAPVEVDTWLCTYAGAPSEGLDPADALRKIDAPGVRAAVLAAARDDADFVGLGDDDLIEAGSFDLHHAPRAGAVPWSFGVHDLWKIAVQWPGSSVPACVHRAPSTSTSNGDAPRLLLIC
ncbi:MAG TPA: hypothetical protein VGF99_03105 [Myxococcota bacterium]